MPNMAVVPWHVITTLAIIAITALLSGCSPRAGAGETAASIVQVTQQTASDSAAQPNVAMQTLTPPLLLDLPALLINYNPEGTPSIGAPSPLGETPSYLGYLPQSVLSQLTLDKAILHRLAQAGIQHMMVSNTPSGLRVVVNGQPLPMLVWDQKSLDNLLDLLGLDDDAAGGDLARLVTTLLNLGVGVVVQIPPLSGSDWPPPLLPQDDDSSNAHLAEVRLQEFMQRIGPAPSIQIPVEYAEDGSWTVHGITDTQWQALTGLPFGYMRLNAEAIRNATEQGIQQVVVRTDTEGIHVTVGDRELPYLRWSDGGLITVIHLLEVFDVISLDSGANNDTYGLLVKQLLPAIQATELRIVVNFPTQ